MGAEELEAFNLQLQEKLAIIQRNEVRYDELFVEGADLIVVAFGTAARVARTAVNHMRDDGMTPGDAILASVRGRIRPIFMTTATTVLGLSPLVFWPGAGNELYRGLGAVVLGGLLVSALFTLVLVPTLFSLLMDTKSALIKRLGR